MSDQFFSGEKIFDAHTHIYPSRIAGAAVDNLEKFYDFKVEGNGTAEELRRISAENGVVGCLLLAVATNAHQVRRVNEYVAAEAELSRASGRETLAFGGFHQDTTDPEGDFTHALGLGIRGFKIHPDIQGVNIDDEKLFPLYRMCRDAGLPVHFHMGDCRPQYSFSEAHRLLHILDKFPGLRVNAAHFGAYSVWDSASILAGHPDIWFDTSSSLWALSPERASELIHLLGTDRCMFGTDYPVKTADTELRRFSLLDLTADERRAVLYGNAANFLG